MSHAAPRRLYRAVARHRPAAREKHGTRREKGLTSLPASANASLYAIACESQTSDCTAIGVYADSSGAVQQGLILEARGGVWARGVTALLPSNADTSQNVSLNAVDCGPTGGCTAAGTFTTSAQQELPFTTSINSSSGG
jgi:hypothetical protein